MSSSHSKRPAHQMPSSVSSRTQKKGRNTEEPTPTPEARIYRGFKSEEESEDEEEEATARTETPPPIGYSSRRAAGSSHEPRLNSIEASIDEIKEEQKRLGKSMEELATCMQTGFEDIKKILGAHTERFGTLDKDVRQLKLRVHNSIHVASNVIQDTVNEFKATSVEDIYAKIN
ncbi:hypothetical protein CJ030_MR2G011743 [Morella rubra]|uniref:Uncharacterized protein n=1 Tax=Morella rubra TaxID=262757 RepID=A0A6A1WEG4_9ROSI|nr:hypothetical protein CJ030_MR2G011743 [Morella rubra]